MYVWIYVYIHTYIHTNKKYLIIILNKKDMNAMQFIHIREVKIFFIMCSRKISTAS